MAEIRAGRSAAKHASLRERLEHLESTVLELGERVAKGEITYSSRIRSLEQEVGVEPTTADPSISIPEERW